MQKYTPGPWRVDNPDAKRFTRLHIHNDDRMGIVAEVNLSRGGSNAPWEGEANARLIAAAPDLLAELRETELNLTQTLLAVKIGKLTKQRRLDFVLGAIERRRDELSATLARIEGRA